jgi:uncharacterized protein
MLTILSPAKTLNFEPQLITKKSSIPVFSEEAEVLVEVLKTLTASDIEKLMSVSPKLAALNYERYQMWNPVRKNSKQAILAFDGDVYDGLDAKSLSEKQLNSAQKRIRILSGLYGVLKPLDLIQPHRLEMGTPLVVKDYKNLYAFWQDKIVSNINMALDENGNNVLVNLASKEYFKSIDSKKLNGSVITVDFKDRKNGTYQIISFFAKKARGLMSRFILENKITRPGDLKAFDTGGYYFSPAMSQENHLVFTRDN